MTDILRDVRFALRGFRRNLGLTVVTLRPPIRPPSAAWPCWCSRWRPCASLLPARRATEVDPIVALRQE